MTYKEYKQLRAHLESAIEDVLTEYMEAPPYPDEQEFITALLDIALSQCN